MKYHYFYEVNVYFCRWRKKKKKKKKKKKYPTCEASDGAQSNLDAQIRYRVLNSY